MGRERARLAGVDVAEAYRQHGPFVWRALLRFGVPPNTLDDATQDVFLVVYRRRRDYDGRRSLRAWLYGIARNVAQKHRARHPHEVVALAEDLASSTELGNSCPHEHAVTREAADFVDRFLGKLDKDKREIFVLGVIEGLYVAEIAELLSLNINTAYSRLRSARKEFTSALYRHAARDRMLTKRNG